MSGFGGRWEATVSVPSIGWDVDLDDGAPVVASIPEGAYTVSALLAELATQLDAVGSQAYTVAGDFGNGGTGQVTIASAGNFSLTWTNTDLRNALGFTENVSGANTYQGAAHAKGVWLPDCVKKSLRGDGVAGNLETDARMAEGPSGTADYFFSASKTSNRIEWQAVSRRRAVIEGEVLANESLETFWRDAILGVQSFFSTGGTLRFFWDADGSDWQEYQPAGDWFRNFPTFVAVLADGWTGRWSVDFARLLAGDSFTEPDAPAGLAPNLAFPSELDAWWSADTATTLSGSDVTNWNSHDATTAAWNGGSPVGTAINPEPQYIASDTDGTPSIQFSGITLGIDVTTGAPASLQDPYTMFVFCWVSPALATNQIRIDRNQSVGDARRKYWGGAARRPGFSDSLGGGDQTPGSSPADDIAGWHLLRFTVDGAGGAIGVDDGPDRVTATDRFILPQRIGETLVDNGAMSLKIKEIFYVNRSVFDSDQEATDIQNWIKAKYPSLVQF